MIRTLLATAVLLALGTGAAEAQKIYKCKSDKGEIYYSQSYDAKFCGGGGAQMNQAGIAVKEIERIKTPEELAAEKVAAEQAVVEKRERDARIKADNVLLQSYPAEADLARAHGQQLSAIDGVVKTTELSIQSHEKSLGELLAAAADSERAKVPVPDTIAKSIETVRGELETQRGIIARKEAEKRELEVDYQARLVRYRELKERQARHLSGQ